MAMEIVAGAALGTVFGALYDVVMQALSTQALSRTAMWFKPLLEDLKFTLDCLEPHIIQQIGDQNVELSLPNQIIECLQSKMMDGRNLVLKLSKLSMWNCYIWCSCCCTGSSFTDQLAELDRSLRILLERLKLQEARNVQEALALARDIHKKQDELLRRQSEIQKMQQEVADLLRAQHEAKDMRIEGNTEAVVHKRTEGNGEQGTVLGAVFGMLFGAIIQVKDKTRMFKRILGHLKSTLDSLKPLIKEIAEYNTVLHLPKEELENFRMQMENGVDLVYKCSKVHRWASCEKYEYTNKLLVLDRTLQKLLNILRAQVARDIRESLDSVSNLEMEIKKIEESGALQNQNQIESKGWCPIPEPQSPTVGLDVMNMSRTMDEKEKLDSNRNLEVGANQIEKSGKVQDQIEIAVADPPSPIVGLDVINMSSTRDENETFISVRNTEVVDKQIEGSGKVQYQIEIAVVEPPSPTVGLDIMNMPATRDENETFISVRNTETVDKQIEGSGKVQDQIEIAAAEPPLPAVGLDVMMRTRDEKEILDSTRNIEAGAKHIEGTGKVKDQIDIALVAEPPSPTVGLDVMNMQGTRDENETLVSVRNTEARDKQIEGIGVVEFEAPFSECKLPSLTVNLDVPLRELKSKFLKDEVSALVLTGPGGCGKTTLAKMFCQDEEVRDKFKNNVFFVSISKEPNLDHIVQQLYQHNGSQVPALQDKAIAVNWLQQFLKETGQHQPSLLVLDDVWSGSESLLDKFDEFKTSNYKILVTSRSEFPSFGSPYYLKSLNDENKVTSQHSVPNYKFEALSPCDQKYSKDMRRMVLNFMLTTKK